MGAHKLTLESNIWDTAHMSHLDHKATSPASVRCYVLTISDTRTTATDTSRTRDCRTAGSQRS